VKRLWAAIFCLILAPLPAAGQEVSITPHSARYIIQLLETRMGDIASADGAMEISLSRDCDAWTLTTALSLSSAQQDGASFDLRVDSDSREALDGRWFEFDSQVVVGGQVQEAYRGRAEIDADGRGEAVYERPREMSVALDQGTQFPIGATSKSLTALFEEGARISNYVLFDGSGETAIRATDLVAGTPDPTLDGLSDPDGLTTTIAKRVVTTFFDMTRTDSEPTMTYIVDILPNGVTTRLTIDLGFMVTEARLIEITLNEPDAC
jgi:hypothetical protein